MKTRNIIGGVLVFAGIFLAVCTADESPNELVLRLGGLVLAVAGTLIGKFHEAPEQK